MYNPTDPRSSLAPGLASGHPAATTFSAAEYARFYADPPQVTDLLSRQWFARGQNFVLVYMEAEAGATFSRVEQPDEYVVLLPDTVTAVTLDCEGQQHALPGYTIAFVPPGSSRIVVEKPGRVVLMFTTRSTDLCAMCSNATAYAESHPNIPAFEAWPTPIDGLKLRQYSLDVPEVPGRFGRIWRCTTFMVNFLPTQFGPRDVTKLSPHQHDTFEQGSLALKGSFMHHVRWPWTPNLHAWRADDHEQCGSPSFAVIPPPAIHTSRGLDAGANDLVDVFSPPRMDFSLAPGWVLNEADYPMPAIQA
ncbi:hypothetical protein [Ottowia thiooxydans]|uniref:hypothetical protein n=1 Tax=Ottowia thiooxydans TaxID=219182 RepID=UPI000400A6E2|nr:hypothetical protein [Ottowia thiooxydans]